MAGYNMMRCGEFRTTYEKDTTIFPTPMSKKFAILGVLLCIVAPLQIGEFEFVSDFMLSLMIQIGYMSIGALGLNILVGFTGQISLGHAAFFGFGAFASAWMSNSFSIPVFFSIPLAGVLTMAVGMMFGMPAARIKGLYLAIATLASQFILEDFFARAEWFTGGSAGALANPFEIFGLVLDGDRSYYYVVLAYMVVMFIVAANLMRSRDGRAFVAVRDHYLSAEVMGINLTWYRVLSFGISSFYAGIAGALYAHYLQYVSVESFNLLLSIQFIGMIIIGGLGSVMGSLMGTIFMVLLPEIMQGAAGLAAGIPGVGSSFMDGINFLKEMTVGLAIVLFLMFEPDGLAHRWRMIKAYWKLYPFSY
ncbi:putative branched-chain amino acid ABC transporter, permease component [Candidatus Terasakiella magnetica]|uniref:Putative branched-chain amino acid ABC transporter, permease component n=1 Tax=Candidatus Terasakiella magnetica TaxID=1867952 RepID=A0A1C3RE89_9PROT|nr:branched-chain amino acid ABC transporter permease [Candidatus Terasakiella magnetica]SCA55575.1 putative branched-chain amino acid ABC transporter, permease component [Candidatus Terasakiella magnetica]